MENRIEIHYRLMSIGAFEFASRTEQINLAKDIIRHFDLDKVSRKRELVFKRQYLMWWLRKNISSTPLKTIGGMFGKDHATVLHAVKTVNNYLSYKDRYFLKCIEDVKQRLENDYATN